MRITLRYAKAHLDDLITAAERGEVVVIVRKGKPDVNMIPIAVPTLRNSD